MEYQKKQIELQQKQIEIQQYQIQQQTQNLELQLKLKSEEDEMAKKQKEIEVDSKNCSSIFGEGQSVISHCLSINKNSQTNENLLKSEEKNLVSKDEESKNLSDIIKEDCIPYPTMNFIDKINEDDDKILECDSSLFGQSDDGEDVFELNHNVQYLSANQIKVPILECSMDNEEDSSERENRTIENSSKITKSKRNSDDFLIGNIPEKEKTKSVLSKNSTKFDFEPIVLQKGTQYKESNIKSTKHLKSIKQDNLEWPKLGKDFVKKINSPKLKKGELNSNKKIVDDSDKKTTITQITNKTENSVSNQSQNFTNNVLENSTADSMTNSNLTLSQNSNLTTSVGAKTENQKKRSTKGGKRNRKHLKN